MNPQYKAAEVAYQLSNAETRALVVALCARLRRAPPVPKPGDAWEAALCG